MSSNTEYDAIVIGGGHNGLVNGAYLAKAGLKTLILERRHLIGGAAITEELRPGFKFTTFSYALGLLRPDIIHELDLVARFYVGKQRFVGGTERHLHRGPLDRGYGAMADFKRAVRGVDAVDLAAAGMLRGFSGCACGRRFGRGLQAVQRGLQTRLRIDQKLPRSNHFLSGG